MSVPGIADTTDSVSGLDAGRRYYVRVVAVAADGRESAWSDPASAIATIDAPATPGVAVTIPGAVRASSAGGWVHYPGSGSYYYAQGTASTSCPSGTSVQYAFQAEYTGTTTVYGWTGWMGPHAYMVQPVAPWGIRFWAKARCVGPDATSGESGVGSACRLRTGGGC